MPEPLRVEELRARFPGRLIEVHASLPTTMAVAQQRAQTGVAHGTVIAAEEQTAGRGRHGHHWHSETGTGLYLSIVLRQNLPAEAPHLLTLALGLAAREAVFQASEYLCDLRWPNDLLLHGRKCAGILTELHGATVIAGIGINTGQQHFPPDLETIATSLLRERGRPVDRTLLLIALLEQVEHFTRLLATGGAPPILDLFSRASSYVFGRRVVVDQGVRELRGITQGLDEAGFLVVCDDKGKRHAILAGGVRPA